MIIPVLIADVILFIVYLGTGVGVSLPGCMGLCCFVCCCFGGPCQTPGGPSTVKMKSDLNDSVFSKPGKGMDL